MRRGILLVLAMLVVVSLRLYPSLSTGLPFYIDSWSIVRNSIELSVRTPVSIGDSKVFDGYNNFWPASFLFSNVLSLFTGSGPFETIVFSVPLAGALLTPIFYVILRRLGLGSTSSALACLLLATMPPYTLYMAGVTKEAYANPIYVTLVLLLLIKDRGLRWVLLVAVTSLTLSMSHHLTSLEALAIVSYISACMVMDRVRRGEVTDARILIAPLMALLVMSAYNRLYGFRGFRVGLTSKDLVDMTSYYLVFYALACYSVAYLRSSRGPRYGPAVLSSLLLFSIVFVATRRPIAPGIPVLPWRYIIYSVPYLILAPLALIGGGVLRRSSQGSFAVISSWLFSTLALSAYSILGGNPFGPVLSYRALNFLSLPFVALAVVPLGSEARRILRGSAALALVLLFMASGLYFYHDSLISRERYTGYIWINRQPELEAGLWVKEHLPQTSIVCGDSRVRALLSEFLKVRVDMYCGLKYLRDGERLRGPLVIYDLVCRNGYLLDSGYESYVAPYCSRLNVLSLAYSGSGVKVYVQP